MHRIGVHFVSKMASQNGEDSRRDSIVTQGSVDGGLDASKDFGEKESSDYVNPRGIRFTAQMTNSSNDVGGLNSRSVDETKIIYFIG